MLEDGFGIPFITTDSLLNEEGFGRFFRVSQFFTYYVLSLYNKPGEKSKTTGAYSERTNLIIQTC